MPIQEFSLPLSSGTSKNFPTSTCSYAKSAGTKVDFNPGEPGDFEEARHIIERHKCKGQ